MDGELIGHASRFAAQVAALHPLSNVAGAGEWLTALDWQQVPSGQRLAPLGAGELWAVAQGELAMLAEERCQQFFEGPAWVGCRGGLHLRAVRPAVVARVDVSALRTLEEADRDLVSELYEAQLIQRDQQRAADARKDDDFFVGDSAQLVPAPYRFGPYTATSLMMHADPGVLRHELPPGLSLAPGTAGKYLLVLNEVEHCEALHPDTDGRQHRYLEVAAFVPCLGPRLVPGLFLPRVYPDAYLPILLGREAYGFAKRLGRILTRPHADGYDLIANGRHILRTRWQRGASDDVQPPWQDELVRFAGQLMRLGRPRLYLHKQILGVGSGPRARPRVDELVALPFRVTSLGDMRRLSQPEVSFPESGWGLGGRCLGGAQLQLGFEFTEGKVVRDYGARRR